MRILQVASHLEIGGIPRHVVTLAQGLARRGHAVAVASGGGVLAAELRAARVAHRQVPLHVKSELHPALAVAVARLLGIVRRERIDLLHAHTRVAQVAATFVSRLTSVPYVATCHGFYRQRLGRRLWPCWGRRTIAISDAVRRWLEASGASSARIAMVLNGIDVAPECWTVSTQEQQRYRQELRLGSEPVIGIVGRVAAVKGHRWLLEAFGALASDDVAAQLLIVGGGPERATLEREVAARPWASRVRWTTAADVRLPLSMMDVVVVPSLWEEPFGLVAVEAMAAGRPVVASRAGGLPEIVVDGETGLLAARGDMPGLASALRRLLADAALRRRLGEAGRQRAVERFSSERMAVDTEAVYRTVLR